MQTLVYYITNIQYNIEGNFFTHRLHYNNYAKDNKDDYMTNMLMSLIEE